LTRRTIFAKKPLKAMDFRRVFGPNRLCTVLMIPT